MPDGMPEYMSNKVPDDSKNSFPIKCQKICHSGGPRCGLCLCQRGFRNCFGLVSFMYRVGFKSCQGGLRHFMMLVSNVLIVLGSWWSCRVSLTSV